MITQQERLKKAKNLARIFCKECPKVMTNDPAKSLHGCEFCWVHWLMNSIAEGKDIEEPKEHK